MSAPEQIYMPLLDEGIDVWRPVDAERIGPKIFRVIGPVPEGEAWAFQTGEIIHCQEKQLSDGTHNVATQKVS